MSTRSTPTRSGHTQLRLLGSWELLCDGDSVPVTPSEQRMIAVLALRGSQPRARLAGTLWPDTEESRALANMRSTLWRLRRNAPRLVDPSRYELGLAPDVHVDLHELTATARQVLAARGSGAHETPDPPSQQVLVQAGELLPGWYDEWVLFERERIHQLRLHALEVLVEYLVCSERYAEAVDAALAAVAAEPFRESAQRTLVQAHLAEGNESEALRIFEYYRKVLQHELGLEPSRDFRELVGVRADAG